MQIEINENWRLYQSYRFQNWKMLGTIQIDDNVSALACTSAGIYCKMNAGSAIMLPDQELIKNEVEKATKK